MLMSYHIILLFAVARRRVGGLVKYIFYDCSGAIMIKIVGAQYFCLVGPSVPRSMNWDHSSLYFSYHMSQNVIGHMHIVHFGCVFHL
jgi:hypothetical protein